MQHCGSLLLPAFQRERDARIGAWTPECVKAPMRHVIAAACLYLMEQEIIISVRAAIERIRRCLAEMQTMTHIATVEETGVGAPITTGVISQRRRCSTQGMTSKRPTSSRRRASASSPTRQLMTTSP